MCWQHYAIAACTESVSNNTSPLSCADLESALNTQMTSLEVHVLCKQQARSCSMWLQVFREVDLSASTAPAAVPSCNYLQRYRQQQRDNTASGSPATWCSQLTQLKLVLDLLHSARHPQASLLEHAPTFDLSSYPSYSATEEA